MFFITLIVYFCIYADYLGFCILKWFTLCFSQVSWLNSGGQGFGLEYPNISLHAVSRDVSSFPSECLYLMVEGRLIGKSKSTFQNIKSRNTMTVSNILIQVRPYILSDLILVKTVYECYQQTTFAWNHSTGLYTCLDKQIFSAYNCK